MSIALSLAWTASAAGIGVIDIEAVLSASDKAQAARAQWQVELAPKEAKLAQLLERGQALEVRLNNDEPTGQARRELLEQMNAIRAEMGDVQQSAQQLLADREQRFLETQLPIIEALVVELAEAKNLDLVIDANAVIWGQPKVNLSDDLLARFNATQ